ncbi:hypothetical protein Pla52o_55340 [Novipirellula galeiformis]|uniref:SGNH hydrolase-type esterase domain-containing protein n=1 Tax=Novipirellula galeiformis TaxID=2528004 RepID=A0A5C6BTK2_9BACT|nr:hypothetical protein Pla52o_55340 [Novipirellula galeiformis]
MNDCFRPVIAPLTLCLCFSVSSITRGQDTASPDENVTVPSPVEVPISDADREAALERWETSIVALEEKNESVRSNEESILFIGSSSIRLWDSIAQDMAPYRCIERGYGGAKFSDLAVFAKRVIEPHQYRGLVVFVANDVAGRTGDHSLEQIEAWVRYIIGVSQAHQPNAAIGLVEVTPTESRFAAWDKIRAVNALLKEIALTTPDTYLIPTAEHYLTADDQPRPELFVADKLHMNEHGYELWGSLIRRRLDDIFRLRAEQASMKP